MAQFIKKVGTTPVRGNGFIIDSFNTNDNKQFNAPSLNAVEERTDNNLFFCGAFINFQANGTSVNGWDIIPAAGYSGSPAQFNPVAGISVPGGYIGTLRSPYFCSFDIGDLDLTKPYSFSVIYNIDRSGITGSKVAKIENVVESSTHPIVDVTLDDALRITIGTLYGGGKVNFGIYNLTQQPIFIIGVKMEQGATCTPFSLIGKDYAVSGAVENAISSKISTIRGTFLTNANGEASANINYPAGFWKENSAVIAVGISDSNGRYHYHKLSSDKTCTREYVILDDGYVNIYYQGTSADANSMLDYRIVLLKI